MFGLCSPTITPWPSCTGLTAMKVSVLNSHKCDVSDESKMEQLGCVLHQLQFPNVKNFSLEIPSLYSLHTLGSERRWTSLITAFEECRYPRLENLYVRLSDLKMNGHAIGMDFCVSSVRHLVVHELVLSSGAGSALYRMHYRTSFAVLSNPHLYKVFRFTLACSESRAIPTNFGRSLRPIRMIKVWFPPGALTSLKLSA